MIPAESATLGWFIQSLRGLSGSRSRARGSSPRNNDEEDEDEPGWARIRACRVPRSTDIATRMKRKTLTTIVLLTVGIAGACTGADTVVTSMYKTRPGDTLGSIAKRFRMKTQDITALNRSVRFDELQVGQPIKVRLKNPHTDLLYPTIPPRFVP